MSKPEKNLPKDIFQALFERSPAAIMIVDDQGRYVLVNKAAETLLGFPQEEILGRTVDDFVAPIRKEPTAELWKKFQEDGSQHGIFRISRPSGVDRTIRYEAAANFIPGYSLSIAHDITDDQHE